MVHLHVISQLVLHPTDNTRFRDSELAARERERESRLSAQLSRLNCCVQLGRRFSWVGTQQCTHTGKSSHHATHNVTFLYLYLHNKIWWESIAKLPKPIDWFLRHFSSLWLSVCLSGLWWTCVHVCPQIDSVLLMMILRRGSSLSVRHLLRQTAAQASVAAFLNPAQVSLWRFTST